MIYGWAVVPEGCTLTIEEGTRVYSHKGSGIIVDEGGTLIVNGKPQNQVVFASDRLDDFYEDQAGEWNAIWLYEGSVNNEIHGALLKNGRTGIQVDRPPYNSSPNLVMTNTIIENMAAGCFFSNEATVRAYNCVFGNGGQVSAYLGQGGDYQFYHCTFGNYWVNGNRQTPALLLNNWFEDADEVVQTFNLTQAYFGNCIIYGNNLTELGLDENVSSAFSFEFENCVMKLDFNAEEPIDVSSSSEFKSMIYNQDPYFVDPSENNFELDSSISSAFNTGDNGITNENLIILGQDVIGNFRPFGSGNPDIGAYERQE